MQFASSMMSPTLIKRQLKPTTSHQPVKTDDASWHNIIKEFINFGIKLIFG